MAEYIVTHATDILNSINTAIKVAEKQEKRRDERRARYWNI